MQSALPGAVTDSPQSAQVAEPRAEYTTGLVDGQAEIAVTAKLIPTAQGPQRYEVTKRLLDLAFGLVGLVFTGLVSLVVVPLILSSSRGPILFRQIRVGKGGKPFTCYKFRTMDPGAEVLKEDIAHLNEADGPHFKIAEDPRHVRELKWLRKFSIDEMPQFWNVLLGDMSIVGPRPPEPQEVARYTDHQLGRLAVKPGMTCTWQVNGRSNVGFDQWVEMDLDYIARRNTRFDIALILKTIPAVLSGRGAS